MIITEITKKPFLVCFASVLFQTSKTLPSTSAYKHSHGAKDVIGIIARWWGGLSSPLPSLLLKVLASQLKALPTTEPTTLIPS